MAMYYNGKKVRNLYYNGKCITRLALGKEMTRLVEGDDFVTAQWLCGRNGAYINTEHPFNTMQDAFIVKGRYDGTLRNPLGKEQAIFGVVEKFSYSDDAIWCYAYIDGGNQVKPILLKINASTAFPDNVPIRSLTKEFVVVLKKSNSDYYAENNGQGATYSNLGVADKTIGNVYLFTRNTDNIPTQAAERYFHGDIAYFRITDPTSTTDRVNMTPCRLLRPIPASLDANGIARNADECGMYNSVNGLFYGNVASSGAFTVEPSLVEGVDYEVHNWLYTELPEANSFMILPIGSDTFSFNRVFYKTNSVVFFRTNGYLYYSSQQRIRLWDINSRRMLFTSSPYQYGELIQVISNSNSDSVTIKDSSIPKYAYDDLDSIVVDFREAYTDGNFASKFKTSKIIVDGVERYIPVRLLRPLPAYLDANGKARSQFECGMLDLKTMKFYGNVAATGKFTVSDN